MKFIKKYDLYFVFGGSLVFAASLMLFRKSYEIGNNLFTEMSGVAMTVFVINKILARKENQKRISIDQRILREVQSIIASYFSIWKHLAWQYFPGEKIETEKDLLKLYPEFVKRAKLNEQFRIVSIHHPESWKLFFHNRSIRECFLNYSSTLSEDIQAFINDFKIYLEPELLDCLLNILECEYFKNIFMMGEEGTSNILIDLEQDTERLDSYISADDTRHLNRFLELFNYSKRLKNKITKFSEVSAELYQLKKYFVHPSQFA